MAAYSPFPHHGANDPREGKIEATVFFMTQPHSAATDIISTTSHGWCRSARLPMGRNYTKAHIPTTGSPTAEHLGGWPPQLVNANTRKLYLWRLLSMRPPRHFKVREDESHGRQAINSRSTFRRVKAMVWNGHHLIPQQPSPIFLTARQPGFQGGSSH